MALLILALLQRIFLMSSLMLLLVWLIFFMVLIKDRKSGSAGMPRPISYAVFCLKKKNYILDTRYQWIPSYTFVVVFSLSLFPPFSFFFFFNDTATTEIYTLSLHDALPIS